MISKAETIVIPATIRAAASEDGAVLLDIEQGVCFSLNAVGLKIWELLKQHCSFEQIVDNLEASFSVPRPQLICDTTEFIAALEAKHLVCRASVSDIPRSRFKRWFTLQRTNRNE